MNTNNATKQWRIRWIWQILQLVIIPFCVTACSDSSRHPQIKNTVTHFETMNHPHLSNTSPKDPPATIRLFLCGDVVTGRGIDQILRYPVSPVIYESYIRDARDYIRIAEKANGPIPHPVNDSYIWGDGLKELRRFSPDIKIINLETAVTSSEECWPDKEINYRMNPKNIVLVGNPIVDILNHYYFSRKAKFEKMANSEFRTPPTIRALGIVIGILLKGQARTAAAATSGEPTHKQDQGHSREHREKQARGHDARLRENP